MSTPNQAKPRAFREAAGQLFSCPLAVFKPAVTAFLLLAMGLLNAKAADVTLKVTDSPGTSSLTGSTNWSDGLAASAGKTYATLANAIRTTNYNVNGGTVSVTFAGDSLSIDPGGRLIGKIGNNGTAGAASTGTVIGNFILNGGLMDEAAGVNGNDVLIVGGTVTVNAASFLGASGATANGSANFETLEIIAPISGSAALQVSGANVNAGADTGTVKLSAANPYSGTLTVPNSRANAAIASAVNRLLQLNNLNALGNAGLNLTSTNGNPVSFASAVNSGPFNVGALSGNSSQALTDTAGGAVALSVGGNNASSFYSGALTGNGSLIKVGTGVLTLAGGNTYTGATTINGGTLALAVGALFTNSSSITVGPNTTLDVSSNAFTLAGGQNLLGGGTVNGAFAVAAGANVYAGLDTVYGTNTFTTNLTFSSGANVFMDMGTAFNGANDLIVVRGNLVLNNTAFHIKAPSGSVNLDQSADYILMTVAGAITGNPNSTPTWEVAPQNANHYSILKSGNNIVLHYNSSLLPTGFGSVSPNPAVHSQPVLITVTVSFSSTPVSSVTADATALGGSSSVPLVSAGSGTYTNTVLVAPGVTFGDKTLTATITDSSSPTPISTTTPGFTVTITSSSGVWNGGGADNNWSTNPNWQGGLAPGFSGDALTFAGTTRLTPDMNANYSVTGLTFDGSAGSFVLGSSGGHVLTLAGDINDNSSTPQTLDLSITNVGNSIHINGNNSMTINGGIAGAGGLEDNVNGILALNGTNSFTGGINLNTGTLQVGGAGLLGGTNGNYAGNITNSGVLQYSSSATQTLSGVVSWFGQLLKDGPGKLILAGSNTYFADTLISNGVLQVTGTLASDLGNDYVYGITDNGTLEMSSSSVQTLGGVISGAGVLIKDGSGTLNINGGNNTYSGGTVVSGGTLAYDPNSVSYATGVGSLVVNGGGTVAVNVNNGSPLPTGNLTLNTNGVLSLNYNFSGGNPSMAAVAVSGTLSSPGTNIIRIGGFGAATGQFPLISYGTLLAGMDHFVVGLPPGVSGVLVNNSANHTIDLNITGVSPTTWIALTAADPANTSSFTNGVNWQDGNPPAAGNGYYTQANTLRSPADTNSYTFGGAALSIDQYGLAAGVGGRLLLKGAGSATITIPNLILNGGLMDYANAADGATKTLAGNILLNNGTTSYIGALTSETFLITAPISGGGNLQVGGANVNAGADTSFVALFGANTYTGSTTVGTGTLLVNGSAPNTTFTVFTNATLGGTGSIGGAVTVQAGGILAPGVSAHGTLASTLGALTISGPVSVSGTVVMSIDRARVPNSDELAASSVTINPGVTLTVNNIGSTNLAAGDTFALFSTPIAGSFNVTNLPALPNSNLVWTNKIAMDGTIAVVSLVTGPSGPEVLTNYYNAAAGALSLSWPANEGWRLQMQTNAPSKGLGTNWVYITDGTTSSTNITIDKTAGSVFFRLTYP